MQNQQIERMAFWLWQQRGMPQGTPDEDWFLAEQFLKGQAELVHPRAQDVPLFAFGLERRTR